MRYVVLKKNCDQEKHLNLGDKALYAIINKGFWESITLRLPDRCINIFTQIINAWGSRQCNFIEEFTANLNLEKIFLQIETNSEELIKKLESEQCLLVISSEVKKTIELYENFSKMLNFHQLVKDRNFNLNVRKVKKFNYLNIEKENRFFSFFLLGIPLLLNVPKNSNIKTMKKIVHDFCIALNADVLGLKPEIHLVLEELIKTVE